jgi:hypothetical protein
LDFPLQCPGLVAVRVNLRTGLQIIGKFHDVIKITGIVVTAHVQDIDQTVMRAGDRLELLDAGKFTVEWAACLEALAPYDFDGAVSTHDAAGQPDFAVRTTANAAQQLVVRNLRRRIIQPRAGDCRCLFGRRRGMRRRRVMLRRFSWVQFSHSEFYDRFGP